MVFNLDTIITFGKYKDTTIERILNWDPSYIIWLFTIKDVNPEVLKTAKTKNSNRILSRSSRRHYLHGNYNNDREYDSAFASSYDWGSQ